MAIPEAGIDHTHTHAGAHMNAYTASPMTELGGYHRTLDLIIGTDAGSQVEQIMAGKAHVAGTSSSLFVQAPSVIALAPCCCCLAQPANTLQLHCSGQTDTGPGNFQPGTCMSCQDSHVHSQVCLLCKRAAMTAGS